MAITPTRPMNDESFHVRNPSPWFPRAYVRRAVLLRWIWAINVIREDGTWGLTTAWIADDFGNLVEVKYVYASVACSKDAI